MKRLVLIDAHALIHRAYHAFPKTLTTSKGEIVNAVYGFTRTILSLLKELEPEYVAVAFDRKGPTVRHEKYKDYKSSRPKVDDELISQFGRAREMVKALGMPIFDKQGYEADDLIGSVVDCVDEKTEVVIVTGDKDTLQLVKDNVKVFMPARGRRVPARMWDEKMVKSKIGVTPNKVDDFKALAGDSSDDIPGVRGIGKKTACKLINQWGEIENIYQHLDEVEQRLGKRVRHLLEEGEESARMSKDLAQIITNLDCGFVLKRTKINDYNKKRAIDKLEELEFKSLISALPQDDKERMVDDIFKTSPKEEISMDDLNQKSDNSNESEQTSLF